MTEPSDWHQAAAEAARAMGYTNAQATDSDDAALIADARALPKTPRCRQIGASLAEDLSKRYTIAAETPGMLARVAANLRGLHALLEAGIEDSHAVSPFAALSSAAALLADSAPPKSPPAAEAAEAIGEARAARSRTSVNNPLNPHIDRLARLLDEAATARVLAAEAMAAVASALQDQANRAEGDRADTLEACAAMIRDALAHGGQG